MSANHSSRQVKAVVRREHTTGGSVSEVSITMSSANSWFLTRGGRMHEIYLIYIMNNMGPRTLPWGSPLEQAVELERLSPISIC